MAKAFSGEYIAIFFRSVLTALLVAAICLFTGYPAAYIVSRMKAHTARLVIVLMVLPMWINFLLRTYAWRALLDDNGLINQFLGAIGIPAQQLLYTQGAVIMGLMYDFLPFMILPIYTALQEDRQQPAGSLERPRRKPREDVYARDISLKPARHHHGRNHGVYARDHDVRRDAVVGRRQV